MRRILAVAGLALALGIPLASIVAKERLLARSRPVLLALAPVDPRSLMQGDYLRLAYAIAREVPDGAPRDGTLVLADDDRGVARLVRIHAGEPLGRGEYLLRYRRRGTSVRLGAESFFFQEGRARAFEAARFGELRADAAGDSVLVGLRDAEMRVLGR